MQGMPTTQERPQKRPCIHRCGPAADEEAVPPVAAGRLRKAESGPGWRELFLSERCDAGATPSAAAAVAAGHSLLQFDVLASASECGALLSEAAALAAAVRAEHRYGSIRDTHAYARRKRRKLSNANHEGKEADARRR